MIYIPVLILVYLHVCAGKGREAARAKGDLHSTLLFEGDCMTRGGSLRYQCYPGYTKQQWDMDTGSKERKSLAPIP